MVGISRDVTSERMASVERERLLKSERRARDEAERQSRLKDEFLATLSHELRTPMNVILGWIEILISGKSTRDVSSILTVLQRNATLQAHMIDELLDMSRLSSGNIRLDLARIDIASLLHATIQGLAATAEARPVQFTRRRPHKASGSAQMRGVSSNCDIAAQRDQVHAAEERLRACGARDAVSPDHRGRWV